MSRRPSFRDPRVAAPGSPAGTYSKELGGKRVWLDKLRVHHINLTKRFLAVADRQLYILDVFLVAVMSRSYCLVDGFLGAFDAWNPIVAAPLLRMQLDSLVRVSYVARAPRADEVAADIVRGGEFRKFKDAHGKRLTDARLVELAKPHHPWVPNVYEATSGWVHLSPVHLRAAWRLDDDPSSPGTLGALKGRIPIRPSDIPLRGLEELIGAMTQATEELFGYAEVWESRKGLPSGQARELQ